MEARSSRPSAATARVAATEREPGSSARRTADSEQGEPAVPCFLFAARYSLSAVRCSLSSRVSADQRSHLGRATVEIPLPERNPSGAREGCRPCGLDSFQQNLAGKRAGQILNVLNDLAMGRRAGRTIDQRFAPRSCSGHRGGDRCDEVAARDMETGREGRSADYANMRSHAPPASTPRLPRRFAAGEEPDDQEQDNRADEGDDEVAGQVFAELHAGGL